MSAIQASIEGLLVYTSAQGAALITRFLGPAGLLARLGGAFLSDRPARHHATAVELDQRGGRGAQVER